MNTDLKKEPKEENPKELGKASAEELTGSDKEEQSLPETECVGPGVCLCEVREQLGLNRAQVGQKLGLTETAVKDLEKQYFDRFPSSVYVRGYLKNYAKILGESETEIIEIYDQFCLENNLDSGKSTLDPLPEKTGPSRLAKIFISLGTIAVLLAVAIFGDFI